MKRIRKIRRPAIPAIDRLRACPRVEIVDDERAIGNGVIVTLKQGWTFDWTCDNRVAGEDTVSAAIKLVRSAQPFSGPFTE